MAEDQKSYPKLAKSSWFVLRDRAQKSPSAKITPQIVAALFSMASAGSARDNIVKPLAAVGIIDEDGTLTELGQLWRNDDTYAQACARILAEHYPEDVQHLGDAAAVERWFTGRGFGASNARQMAATFRLLSEAKIPDEVPVPGATKPKTKPERISGASKSTKMDDPKTPPPAKDEQAAGEKHDGRRTALPSLQMNLQIHLPSDATAEQIDTIFASMAKHLYNK